MKLNFSIGILSWGSPRTLHNTLLSYKESGLFDLTDDVIIFFQECTETDIAIAEEFGINNIISSSDNVGIGRALTELAKAGRNEHILLLENDWVCAESSKKVSNQINEGLVLLDNYTIDAIKYRHRTHPGDPLYTRQFSGREMDCQKHLLECVHWRKHPDLDFPKQIRRVFPILNFHGASDEWYTASSQYCSQTNNPCMYKKEFYLKNISPFSGEGVDLEGKIQDWWQEQNFTVAHGDGLFTHLRLDR